MAHFRTLNDSISCKQKRDRPLRLSLRFQFKNFYCSKPSCMIGNCSLAFASDFSTIASADSEDVLRAVAISLTSKYLARSSIFFYRKESGLLGLGGHRIL